MSNTTSAFRWFGKKIARKSLAFGSMATGLLMLSELLSHQPRIRVLTYHRFGDIQRDPFCVSPKDFEKQMAYLAERQLAVSLSDLEEFLHGRKTLNRDAVLVTIDDGFRSLHSTALPILKDYLIPAVAFITPGVINSQKEADHLQPINLAEPYLTWDEITQVCDNGVTIGSHAWTHRSLGGMVVEEVEEEASRSRDALERNLQRPIKAFAYPYGTRADFSPTTAQILKRSGYTCAFTSQHGAVHTNIDAFSLPRVKVEGGEGVWLFRLLTRGGLDAWRVVDHTLWRLQAR